MKRPVTIEDLQRVVQPSSASSSPDDRYLVYSMLEKLMEENEQKSYITVMEMDSRRELHTWEGSSPLWSPVSNEVAYMAKRNGESFLCAFSLATNQHAMLVPIYESNYFLGHSALKNYSWSPDGLTIAYIGARPSADSADSVRVIDRLLYKTKGGGGRPAVADDALSHVWIIPARGGNPSLITDGSYNEHSLCWSPDGSNIAFISNRSEDPDNNQFHDLWSVNIEAREITRYTHRIGTAHQPAWSPDGGSIAFLATTSQVGTNDSVAEDAQLYLVSTRGYRLRCISKSLDRRIEKICWHSTDQVIYFLAGDRGSISIYCVHVESESISHVFGEECHVLEYAMAKKSDRIVCVKTDISHPADIFQVDLATPLVVQMTNSGAELRERCLLPTAETFWFDGFDGLSIQGWLVRPVHFHADEKHPVVLIIHGGPHNMFGYEFEERTQLLAARGCGVLLINPRGSSGYGQRFSSGCVQNWGGGDYQDLMAGVDAVIQRNSWIDASRLGVTGQSYGGYMTNWIITQTHRFKAAVADGSISNLVSFSGTSLYHSLIESEFNGSAYDNFPLLWKCSPLRCVKNVSTPTLLLHGESDNEVPLSQAEEFFVGLKKNGVDCQFVQYVGEGHGWRPDLKPRNRADVLKRIADWMDRYLKGVISE